MNTSDQSLFPIDSAFKRRWDWKYVPISNAKKGWVISVNGQEYDWWSFIENINQKIWDATHSEDKMLGYFFCQADRKALATDDNNTIISADKFVGKVLFYIYNDVFKDYGFDDIIFKDKDDGNNELLFHSFFKADGKAEDVKIEVFLKNLKVLLASDVIEDEQVDDHEDENMEAIQNDDENEEAQLVDEDSLQGNDQTKYSFNGKEGLGKGQLAVAIIEKYIKEHPDIKFDTLKETFPDSMMGDKLKLIGLIVKAKDVQQASYSYQKKAYGYFKKERKYKDADGVEFFVSNYWNITNIQSIIDFATEQGWEVKVNS